MAHFYLGPQVIPEGILTSCCSKKGWPPPLYFLTQLFNHLPCINPLSLQTNQLITTATWGFPPNIPLPDTTSAFHFVFNSKDNFFMTLHEAINSNKINGNRSRILPDFSSFLDLRSPLIANPLFSFLRWERSSIKCSMELTILGFFQTTPEYPEPNESGIDVILLP